MPDAIYLRDSQFEASRFGRRWGGGKVEVARTGAARRHKERSPLSRSGPAQIVVEPKPELPFEIARGS